MLVLTRKVGESIRINDDIKVTVIEIKGKTIRLGIEASPETKVYREEVFERIKEENRSAASPQFDPAALHQILQDNIKL
ncbi:Carbon storage regulator [Nitrospina gracilis 3/211]|uniref:Translational regulator CsrA n=1 Tax=Nitrospina gracilis (strain 3/211) TaxID=1266370 RepID=M1ZCV5_NITG3|nr:MULTISPECIES: carbon storage regulator CsrA [Nitrospina]MCF8722429.1 carbon storage regulator [Nitrospina sp. Nb-3]CCQ91213.1 Carbon storage regulator [Nitrospina gracilis 3/211]